MFITNVYNILKIKNKRKVKLLHRKIFLLISFICKKRVRVIYKNFLTSNYIKVKNNILYFSINKKINKLYSMRFKLNIFKNYFSFYKFNKKYNDYFYLYNNYINYEVNYFTVNNEYNILILINWYF